ncbi:MAG: hypothetical protein ACTSVK_00680 [Promethearchaeota archaeon]
MQVQYLSPLSNFEVEINSLFSNEYLTSFFKKLCDPIQSRMWRLRKAKNARSNAEDFLRISFYSKITGRSIRSANERLNKNYSLHKKGNQKIHIDGRKKREIPHQTDVNNFLQKVGL